MKLLAAVAVILLCLSFALSAPAQTVQTDWVRGTDFSRFHNFTWATGQFPIQDAEADLKMADAIQAQLQAKGINYVGPNQRFDCFVTYNLVINPDPQNTGGQIITVALRFFDARNNTVVWRAGSYVPLVPNNLPENRKNVKAVIAKMFAQFPPS
ncbi:MAG TPA: DUF4136 domain-containing protein [Terriglobales bacterium]|nr:DUF4136 domain-containing protein [Terriglobales bacterium]